MDEIMMLAQIKRASKEYTELTGEQCYLYVSEPTSSQLRVVFRDKTCLSYAEAMAYVGELLSEAVRSHR